MVIRRTLSFLYRTEILLQDRTLTFTMKRFFSSALPSDPFPNVAHEVIFESGSPDPKYHCFIRLRAFVYDGVGHSCVMCAARLSPLALKDSGHVYLQDRSLEMAAYSDAVCSGHWSAALRFPASQGHTHRPEKRGRSSSKV